MSIHHVCLSIDRCLSVLLIATVSYANAAEYKTEYRLILILMLLTRQNRGFAIEDSVFVFPSTR